MIMQSKPAGNELAQTEAILRRYSNGDMDRRFAMKQLDVSYSAMLQMLHEYNLPMPAISDDEAKAMAARLSTILDAAES